MQPPYPGSVGALGTKLAVCEMNPAAVEAAQRLDSMVVLMALLMDIGWILGEPRLGIPAMMMALSFQTYAVISMHRSAMPLKEMAQAWSLVLWIIGGAVWMFAEYLWDDVNPAGVLARFQTLNSLSSESYAPMLAIAGFIMWTAFAGLAVVYAQAFLQSVRAKKLGAPEEEDDPLQATTTNWFAPWLFMEACWTVSDALKVKGLAIGQWFPLSVIGAIMALYLCSDCIRSRWRISYHGAALLGLAELAWVAGNLAWLTNDVLTDDDGKLGAGIAVAFFVVGACSAVAGMNIRDGAKQSLLSGPLRA